MPIEDAVHNIADQLLHEQILPVVGAGFSPAPGWDTFVARIAARFFHDRRPELDRIALLELPYRVELQQEGARAGLTEIVRDLYGLSLLGKPTPYYDELRHLPLRTIITTNFDPLLEHALKPEVIITKDEDVSLWSPQKLSVVKMHGSWDSNFVLTERDYIEYERNFAALSKLVFALLMTHSVLFLGFSFRDPNIRLLFSRVRHLLEPHRRGSYYVGFDIDETQQQYLRSGVGLIVIDLADLSSGINGKRYRELINDRNKDDLREKATLAFLRRLVDMTRPTAHSKEDRERLLLRETYRFKRNYVCGSSEDPRSIVRLRASVGPFGIPKQEPFASRIWKHELVPLLLERLTQMKEIVQIHDAYAILTPSEDFQTQREYRRDECLTRLQALLENLETFGRFLPVLEKIPTGLSTYVFGTDVVVQSLNTGADGRKLYDGAVVVTERRSVEANIKHFDRAFGNLAGLTQSNQEDFTLPIRNQEIRAKIRQQFREAVQRLVHELTHS